MKKLKIPQQQRREDDSSPPRRVSIGRIAYTAFLCVTMAMMFCQPAFAATDVWTKAKEIMQDVYTQILAISTIAAIVTASVALLLIPWAGLNGLGFIMAYVTPLFSGGQWTG